MLRSVRVLPKFGRYATRNYGGENKYNDEFSDYIGRTMCIGAAIGSGIGAYNLVTTRKDTLHKCTTHDNVPEPRLFIFPCIFGGLIGGVFGGLGGGMFALLSPIVVPAGIVILVPSIVGGIIGYNRPV